MLFVSHIADGLIVELTVTVTADLLFFTREQTIKGKMDKTIRHQTVTTCRISAALNMSQDTYSRFYPDSLFEPFGDLFGRLFYPLGDHCKEITSSFSKLFFELLLIIGQIVRYLRDQA